MDIRQRAEEIIESEIRPFLREHNGDIYIKDIENSVIKVVFTGACKTCPSAQITIEEIVKKTLKTGLGESVTDIRLVNETDEELLSFAKKLLNKK